MAEIRVLLFGPPAMAAGADSITVKMPAEATCGQLKPVIAEQFPALRAYVAAARFAVNSRYGESGTRITSSDEIAMISMVSGG